MRFEHHLDLVALAVELKKRGDHKALVSAIQRAADIGSIRDDLRHATSSLRIVREMGDSAMARSEILEGEDDEATIAGALFISAIILYARATFASDARMSLGDEVLSAEDKATHDEVKMLRNSAIAHFGLGEGAKEGPIVREAVIRSFNKKQYRYGVYTTRAQHKVELGARMEQLVAARLDQVADKQQKLLDAVETRLNEALKADEALGRQLPSFRFDANRFCASPTAAKHMRTALATGDVGDANFTTAVRRPDANRAQ
ncbi:MAG: hypothetical protein ACOY45_09410 [Pseudomonadota bacterium]